jgi:2-haloalkanoic acid dehalogenase type II
VPRFATQGPSDKIVASSACAEAVLVDFYGTLCAGDREAVEQVCTRVVEVAGLAVSPQAFAVRWGEAFFRHTDCSNHSAFRTLIECVKCSLGEVLNGSGLSAEPAAFLTELEAYWRNPPVYADALTFLRELPVPVCCVSNADTEPLEAAIRSSGLRFDAVVASETVRAYKPDPTIFRTALRRLGVDPSRAVHIGDSLHCDVGGAKAAGIPSVWLCRESRIHDIGTDRPDWTIRSLADFDVEACRKTG